MSPCPCSSFACELWIAFECPICPQSAGHHLNSCYTRFSLLLTAGVAVDQQNNIYISDTNRSRILKVNQQTGVTSVYAGTGMSLVIGQPNGDGGPATSGVLNYPEGLAVAANGDLYIAEAGDVRKVAGNIEARRAGSSRRLHCQRLFYVGQPD